MSANQYDDNQFFERYQKMARSIGGLAAAGEWHEFQKMLPDLSGKRLLDLGCGFGWHCRYAAEQGAASVVGIDLSAKMLQEARAKKTSPVIEYIQTAIEQYDFPENSFDVVISSLALHYLESFTAIAAKCSRCLKQGGFFIFSVEHPIFTAEGSQRWCYDADGKALHWPVDRYFAEGVRSATFLGTEVTKYHKTLTTYCNGLLQNGFELIKLVEPQPAENLLQLPAMQEELRRPMMLLIAARKK